MIDSTIVSDSVPATFTDPPLNHSISVPQKSRWIVSEFVVQTEATPVEGPAPTQPTVLVSFELEQGKHQQAAEKSEEFRKELQFAKASAWSGVLAKNWQAFKALRQKAAASPHGQTPCT